MVVATILTARHLRTPSTRAALLAAMVQLLSTSLSFLRPSRRTIGHASLPARGIICRDRPTCCLPWAFPFGGLIRHSAHAPETALSAKLPYATRNGHILDFCIWVFPLSDWPLLPFGRTTFVFFFWFGRFPPVWAVYICPPGLDPFGPFLAHGAITGPVLSDACS